jgi:hypothetical protein
LTPLASAGTDATMPLEPQHPSIRRFLDALSEHPRPPVLANQVRAWAATDRVERLVELALTLEEYGPAFDLAPERLEWAVDTIERTLALTPGPAQAEAAVQLVGRPRQHSLASERDATAHAGRLAAMLAAAQPARVLEALFQHHEQDSPVPEVLACLLHEALLRRAVGEVSRSMNKLAARLFTHEHPLGALSLRLSPLETEAWRWMRNYAEDGTHSAALPFGPWYIAPWNGEPARIEPPTLLEDPARTARLGAATEAWLTGSNGKHETLLFTLAAPLDESAWSPALLSSLPLASLQGARSMGARPASAAEVWELLFAAAVQGGTYGLDRGHAYARRDAWRALGALCGAPADTTLERIASLAEACSWLLFDADNDWFYAVAWDFGIAALAPDRQSVAVLAATDTD